MASQPTATADKGIILTFGILSNADRCAIVVPVFTDNSTLDATTLAQDAIDSADATISASIADTLATDSFLTFIQAEGMIDGIIPSRIDYAPSDFPGTRTGVSGPSSNGALMEFYRDPADPTPSGRVSVAKNIIPGISTTDVSGDVISLDLQSNVVSLAVALQEGFASAANPSQKWYRAAAALERSDTTGQIPRTITHVVRRYIGTQRRRLTPH